MTPASRTKPSPSPLVTLGLTTNQALVHYYPKSHAIYRRSEIAKVKAGDSVTVVGTVLDHTIFAAKAKKNLVVQTWSVADLRYPARTLSCTHFHVVDKHPQMCSAEWREQQNRFYRKGVTVRLSGTVKTNDYSGELAIDSSEVLRIDPKFIDRVPTETLQPIYKLTKRLDTATLQDHINLALLSASIIDPLPPKLRERYDLIPLEQALSHIHFPPDQSALQSARYRLVFDEFFYLQLALLWKRHQTKQYEGIALTDPSTLLDKFYDILPFTLTEAQQRVIDEIMQDLSQPNPMNRLVQGDVGSGKTIVALAACLRAIEAGYQTTLMAPTEILAQQHYQKAKDWFSTLGLTTALLTGSTPTKGRRVILGQLITGQIDLLIGTHALIQPTVMFQNLGLVVIDEQHRFGVEQRIALQSKGEPTPHLLSMTATPIPRTLALTLYGDLDVSQIDEMPPGRKPINTRVMDTEARPFFNQIIKQQLAMGHQVYIVLPLVSASKHSELQSATDAFDRYTQQFPEHTVGLLHGRMQSEEKNSTLDAFRANHIQLLVSTTVIEVGVDVPNATVMMIEHAEHFGLSQLHQLRGRVGRGSHQSYCLLLDTSGSSETRNRLDVLARTDNGFTIAEADLQLRGSGEILGTQQTGTPKFALADLTKDGQILDYARNAARQVIAKKDSLRCWDTLLVECDRRGHLEKAGLQTHLN